MEQHVKFTIGSIFKGEGFKQAQQAVSDVNTNVKKSAALCSQLASTVGMVDASYANAITGMLAALTSGNPVLIATQVAVTGVTMVLDTLKKSYDDTAKEAEEAYQRVKAMRDQMVKAFNKEQQSDIELFIGHLKSIESNFDAITKSAREFTAAMNKLDKSYDTEDVLQMKIDQFNSLANSNGSDADKALLKAKNDLALVLQENANKEKYAQQEIDAANKKRIDGENKLHEIDNETAAINEKRQDILKELHRVGSIDVTIQERLVKNLEELDAKQKALDEQRLKAEDQIVNANRETAQAEQDYNVQLKRNELARLEAQQKVADAETSAAEQEQNDAYERHQQYMEFIRGCEEQIEQMERIRKQEQDDADKKHDAQLKLLDQMEKELKAEQDKLGLGRGGGASSNLAYGASGSNGDHPSERQQQTSNAWNNNPGARGLVLDTIDKFFQDNSGPQIANKLNLQNKQAQNKIAQGAKEQALNQGASRASAEKAGRDAAKAYRDAASSKEGRQLAQDAKRMNDLQRKLDRGGKLTDKEKKELEDLKRQQAGKNADKLRAEEQLKNINELPNNVKKIADNVDAMKKQLDKLGLK